MGVLGEGGNNILKECPSDSSPSLSSQHFDYKAKADVRALREEGNIHVPVL